MEKLELCPVTYKEACTFIDSHHRHHLPPQGWKFGIATHISGTIVGVVTVGRPVSRYHDNGWTLEVTRCCTDGTKNACSKLYGTAWRATKALGYQRLITYTLASESGGSLKASNWKVINEKAGGKGCNRPSRPRIEKSEICQKTLWEAV